MSPPPATRLSRKSGFGQNLVETLEAVEEA
jgi:hypothetical protein